MARKPGHGNETEAGSERKGEAIWVHGVHGVHEEHARHCVCATKTNVRFRNAEVVGNVGVRTRLGGGACDQRGGRGVEPRVALGRLCADEGERGTRWGEGVREREGMVGEAKETRAET